MMTVIVIASVELGLAVHLRNTFRDEELYPELIFVSAFFLHGIVCAIIFVISLVMRLILNDNRYAASLRFRLSPPEVPIPETSEGRDGAQRT